MPRKSVKQRRGGIDPNAFEFTGEEAIQADKAAKSRPLFRRQKLSILSALPEVSNSFTTLAEKPVLTFKSAEDADKCDKRNKHELKFVPKHVRHSIDVSMPETKGKRRSREKPASRAKSKLVRRKALPEAFVSPSAKREITPDPPITSSQNATHNSSEASSALRRSGRKRYRTAKALQVFEESRKKPRMQKRRRSDPIMEKRGSAAGSEYVLGNSESLNQDKIPSGTEETHQPVHEEISELHPEVLEENNKLSDIENVDPLELQEDSFNMLSEAKLDSLMEDEADNDIRSVVSTPSAAIHNMAQRIAADQNQSRTHLSLTGHPSASADGDNVDDVETKDLEPRPYNSMPLMGQQSEEHPAGFGQPATADVQHCKVSDQDGEENSRNGAGLHPEKHKSHTNQKHVDKTIPGMESRPSPSRSLVKPIEKDQVTSSFVSPVMPVEPKKEGMGYTSDPNVAHGSIRDAAEGQNWPLSLKIKESTTSSEARMSVTPGAHFVKQANPASIRGLDEQHERESSPEQEPEAQSKPSTVNEACEQAQEPSSSQMSKTTLKSGDMGSADISRCESTTRFPVTSPTKAAAAYSPNNAGDIGSRNGEIPEVHECDREADHSFTNGEEVKGILSEHSVKSPEPDGRLRPRGAITASSEDTIRSIPGSREVAGSHVMKTDLPTTLTECKIGGSGTGTQSPRLSPDPPITPAQVENASTSSPHEDFVHSSSGATHIDLGKQCKSCAITSQGTPEIDGEHSVPPKKPNRGQRKAAQEYQHSLQDSQKPKQTFSKRVRFVEPEKSSLPSLDRKGSGDFMKMTMRKVRRRQMSSLVPNSSNVTVITMRGSGPDEKEKRVYLDELQYLLDGIFKSSGKAEEKSPQLESQLIAKTLISLTQLLARKSREVKSSEEDESDSALIQILSAQPALFRSIVSQLCGVFGKSRSIDAMLAAALVLIFRATPKLCLISATELDILLNAFFRSSAAALKESEVENTKRSSAAKEGKIVDIKKRRGRLAKRFDESGAESSVLSALNKVVVEANIAEEEFSGFKNEAVAGSHLIGVALSLVLCFHENLRSVMQENRRLDKVVAVLYSCEKLLVQKKSSNTKEKKLHFVHNEASTSWVVMGASLKVLEFALLDKVCQMKTTRESRLCDIVVDVIRSVECLREGMFGSEWILSAALRVAINLCHGFDEASRQFVKQKGHELALTWVAKECYVSGLLSGELLEHHCSEGIEESFDVRVLCLALLATIVDQEPGVCNQFHQLNVRGFKKRNAGGLEIAIQVLQAAETVLEQADAETKAEDLTREERRRPSIASSHLQCAERAELVLEKRITIGYASLLVGALVHENVKNREMAEKLIPSDNFIGIAAVLTGFLEFHHEVGIISGSMDRMYARIIDSLVKPFHRRSTALVHDGDSEGIDRDRNLHDAEEGDVAVPPEAGCT